MMRAVRAIWKHLRWTPSLATCVLALLLAMFAAGCRKESGLVCHPVRGEVTFDGRPLPEAQIVFHPQGNWPAGAPRPIAQADEQGQFVLTTWQTGDGAPAGVYTVTVELREPRQRGEETVRDGRNLLPTRYAKLSTSDLHCEVLEQEENVVRLALKSKR